MYGAKKNVEARKEENREISNSELTAENRKKKDSR